MPHPSDSPGRTCQDRSFPKKDRLLRRFEFLAATRRGRRHSTRYFLVYFLENRVGRPRLGIVASKKVGNAVKRNHLKRRIREFFRLHKSRLPAAGDMVVVAKRGIPFVPYGDVCRDLSRFLDTAFHRARRRRGQA